MLTTKETPILVDNGCVSLHTFSHEIGYTLVLFLMASLDSTQLSRILRNAHVASKMGGQNK